MKKVLFALCVAASGSVLSPRAAAAPFSGYEVAAEGAWCWFADPRALHHESTDGSIDNTYIGYIDTHGAIKAMQVDHRINTAQEVLVRSYFQPDDHDNPTFLVLPDDRVMVFYSRHTDEACFYYRISRKPGDLTTLGEEKVLSTSHNTTYPSPFILSDDPEHIYLCWRGINWHPTIGRLTLPDADGNVRFDWGPKQIVQSTGARPYAKYVSNGKDCIGITYTTGHPDNEKPNFVYFNQIHINADAAQIELTDVQGNRLAMIDDGPHQVNKTQAYVDEHPVAVVDHDAPSRDWVWEVAWDADGTPVIAMVRISSGKTSHDYYLARWNGSEWSKTFLANGGGHFHQTPNLEMCYSGGMAIDGADKNVVYCSVPVEGEHGTMYEIVKYTVSADGQVTSEAVTSDSEKNNARPYSIPGADGTGLHLAWMHGDYYDWIVSSSRPRGYATGIRSIVPLPEAPVDLEDGLLAYEEFDTADGLGGTATVSGGMLALTPETSATIAVDGEGEAFSVVLTPYLDADAYSGRLVSMEGWSYDLPADAKPKPCLTVDGTAHGSTNVLGNSDVWQTQGRGTNGQWYAPSKLPFFTLAITYADGVMRTYIDGLLDQYVEAPGLQAGDLTIGGFEGMVENCRVYGRALSQAEVKQLVADFAGRQEAAELQMAYEALTVPRQVCTDIVLPAALATGHGVAWTSSDESVLPVSGLVNLPQAATPVRLTATVDAEGLAPKVFDVTVMPRDITQNQVLAYTFDEGDLYEGEDGTRRVRDHSGRSNDLRVYGNAEVNGTLDLTANTLTGFADNGYAQIPDGLLGGLRSYTVMARVLPSHLDKLPRLYDFGSASSNSMFGRLNGFCVGFKYNGSTTVMINARKSLAAGEEAAVAFTFDAKSRTSRIYLDGELVAEGTTIAHEPYELAAVASDTRNYIGRTQWWDSGEKNNNADYCGLVDDFRLYDIALTADELAALQPPAALHVPDAAHAITLYPNPAAPGQPIQVELGGTIAGSSWQLAVYDAQGRLVGRQSCVAASSLVLASPQSSGLYQVVLQADGMPVAKEKIMVK